MDVIADGMLFLAALSAAAYCAILSKRLRNLANTDGALNGAIAKLNAEVEDMRAALAEAKRATESAAGDLDLRVTRALTASSSLESLTTSAEDVSKATDAAVARAEEAAASARGEAEAATAAAERLEVAAGRAADLVERLAAIAVRAENAVEAAEEAGETVALDDGVSIDGAAADAAAREIEPEESEPVTTVGSQDEAVAAAPKGDAESGSASNQVAALLAMRDGDEDDVFANRLVDALSSLEQRPAVEAAPQ